MKTKKRVIAAFMIMCLSTMMVFGSISIAKDYSSLGCVQWVKDRASEKLGITLPPTGLNEFGLYGASAYWTNLGGYNRGSEPAANSLAVWKYNNGGDDQNGRYGHCAFVEAVNGNQVTVTEGGCPGYSHNGNSGVICRTQDKGKMSTLGGCSGFLGYIYLTGGNGSNITFSDQKTTSVSANGAILHTRINNPNRLTFSSCGCYLYDANNQLVKSYSEPCSLKTSYVLFDLNILNEMKISLKSGTLYRYVLYCVVDGKTYKDTSREFRTSGPTPDKPSISFMRQKIYFTTSDNAEVFVYIDNPQKYTVSRVGCYLYLDGALINSYSEECGLSSSYVLFTLNFVEEAKIRLCSSCEYQYVLYAVVNGQEYKDAIRSFTTKNDSVVITPAPTVAPTPTCAPDDYTHQGNITKVITWALNVAADDSHGYSQLLERRWGNPDYDCSSFVISAYINEGYNVSEAKNTRNMRNVFVEQGGFKWIPRESIDLSNSQQLCPGDVLLSEGVHTEMYVGFETMVGAHGGSFSIYDENNPGDDNGEEISLVPYRDKNWDGVLRFKSTSTDSPSATNAPSSSTKPSVAPIASISPSAKPATPIPSSTSEVTNTPSYTPEATYSPKPCFKVGLTKIGSINKKKSSIEISFSKAKNASKYQVMYSKNASFLSPKIIWTAKRRIKISSLKRKTRYYIRVRGYNSGKYGKWSSKKSIKTTR